MHPMDLSGSQPEPSNIPGNSLTAQAIIDLARDSGGPAGWLLGDPKAELYPHSCAVGINGATSSIPVGWSSLLNLSLMLAKASMQPGVAQYLALNAPEPTQVRPSPDLVTYSVSSDKDSVTLGRRAPDAGFHCIDMPHSTAFSMSQLLGDLSHVGRCLASGEIKPADLDTPGKPPLQFSVADSTFLRFSFPAPAELHRKMGELQSNTVADMIPPSRLTPPGFNPAGLD